MKNIVRIITQYIQKTYPLFVMGFLVILLIALPILVPVNGQNSVVLQSNLVLDINSKDILIVKTNKIEFKPIDYGKKVSVVRISPPDIPLEAKRALVKAAAAKYGIDWEILEAVWQVESGKSWDTNKRSYAGATGPLQFIPSTFRKYGEDADGDGRVNIYDAEDALFAAARLLASAGLTRNDVKSALFAYNHSTSYVNKVLDVARSIGSVMRDK